MSAFSNIDWNTDLITSSHGPRRSSDDSCLDWNMELDDLFGKDNAEFRRHSEPASLPSRRAKKALAVRFDKVQVREYLQTMGDNPACAEGPSLSIGWKHETLKPVNIETWEALRCHKRRNKQGLYLTADQRASILLVEGFARRDIERNMDLISYFREERNETIMALHLERTAKSVADKVLTQRHSDALTGTIVEC